MVEELVALEQLFMNKIVKDLFFLKIGKKLKMNLKFSLAILDLCQLFN